MRSPIGRPASTLILATMVILCAGGSRAALAAESSEDSPETAPSRGPIRTFMEKYGYRLLAAYGIDQAGQIYERSVGTSRDPLLFTDPPDVDVWIHNSISGPATLHGYLEKDGVKAMRYGTAAALIGMNLVDRDEMLPDLMGFLETWYTNRGLTKLIKNVIGRERPVLEFAHEEGATPARVDALQADPENHESFPSGHTSASFAFASYLERAIARKVGLGRGARVFSFAGLYGVAGYIGFSRIRRSQHYFTDIVAGAALGASIGRTYYRINHPDEYGGGAGPSSELSDRDPDPAGRWSFHLQPPVVLPGGAALTMTFTR
jgi:membrane-associated phospholipid phosphatase